MSNETVRTGEGTIHLKDGTTVKFKGYYYKNEPYNGRIEKYDKDNNLIMKGGFLCSNGEPKYDKRNYHGYITEYKDGKILHTGTYEQFGGERTIPIGEHRYYSDGNLKRIETYNKYGKLDGDVKRYDDFGNLKFSGRFNNGVCHGTYYYTDSQNVRHTLYEGDVEFSEGSKTYLGPFIAPMHNIYPHGNGKVYDGNGHLRYEGRYWNGKRNGLVKEYQDNGNLKGVGVYEDDKYNGIVREHHDNGQLMCVSEYKDNELHGSVIEYNDNGKLKFEGKYSEGRLNGNVKEYHDNGNLMRVSEYKDDMRNGSVKEYNDNGRLIFEGEYYKDVLNGRAKKYDDNGKVIFEGEYKDKNGHGKEYDANGNLIFEGKYHSRYRYGNGKEYDANGKVIFEGEYYYGQRHYGKEYDDNGKVIFEGEYSDGYRKSGKEYDADGKLIFQGKYYNRYRDGRVKEYDDNGRLIFQWKFLIPKGNAQNSIPYNGEKYTYNTDGQLIKTERIKNREVVQQTNYISNENKFNLGSQNKGLGKK